MCVSPGQPCRALACSSGCSQPCRPCPARGWGALWGDCHPGQALGQPCDAQPSSAVLGCVSRNSKPQGESAELVPFLRSFAGEPGLPYPLPAALPVTPVPHPYSTLLVQPGHHPPHLPRPCAQGLVSGWGLGGLAVQRRLGALWKPRVNSGSSCRLGHPQSPLRPPPTGHSHAGPSRGPPPQAWLI